MSPPAPWANATVDFPALRSATADQLQRCCTFLSALNACLTSALPAAGSPWIEQNVFLLQLQQCLQQHQDLLVLSTTIAVLQQSCPPAVVPLPKKSGLDNSRSSGGGTGSSTTTATAAGSTSAATSTSSPASSSSLLTIGEVIRREGGPTLPDSVAKLPLHAFCFPYAECCAAMWTALDPQYPIGVQRRSLEMFELYTSRIVGEEWWKAAAERMLQQRDFGFEEDDMPHERTLINETFPLIMIGVLQLLPQCSMQIKVSLLDFVEAVMLFLSPSAVLQSLEGILVAVLPLLEEAEGSELHRRGLRLLVSVRRKAALNEQEAVVYGMLWRLLVTSPERAGGVWEGLEHLTQQALHQLQVEAEEEGRTSTSHLTSPAQRSKVKVVDPDSGWGDGPKQLQKPLLHFPLLCGGDPLRVYWGVLYTLLSCPASRSEATLAHHGRTMRTAMDFLLRYLPLRSFLIDDRQQLRYGEEDEEGRPARHYTQAPEEIDRCDPFAQRPPLFEEGDSDTYDEDKQQQHQRSSPQPRFTEDHLAILVAAGIQMAASPLTSLNIAKRVMKWIDGLETAPGGSPTGDDDTTAAVTSFASSPLVLPGPSGSELIGQAFFHMTTWWRTRYDDRITAAAAATTCGVVDDLQPTCEADTAARPSFSFPLSTCRGGGDDPNVWCLLEESAAAAAVPTPSLPLDRMPSLTSRNSVAGGIEGGAGYAMSISSKAAPTRAGGADEVLTTAAHEPAANLHEALPHIWCMALRLLFTPASSHQGWKGGAEGSSPRQLAGRGLASTSSLCTDAEMPTPLLGAHQGIPLRDWLPQLDAPLLDMLAALSHTTLSDAFISVQQALVCQLHYLWLEEQQTACCTALLGPPAVGPLLREKKELNVKALHLLEQSEALWEAFCDDSEGGDGGLPALPDVPDTPERSGTGTPREGGVLLVLKPSTRGNGLLEASVRVLEACVSIMLDSNEAPSIFPSSPYLGRLLAWVRAHAIGVVRHLFTKVTASVVNPRSADTEAATRSFVRAIEAYYRLWETYVLRAAPTCMPTTPSLSPSTTVTTIITMPASSRQAFTDDLIVLLKTPALQGSTADAIFDKLMHSVSKACLSDASLSIPLSSALDASRCLVTLTELQKAPSPPAALVPLLFHSMDDSKKTPSLSAFSTIPRLETLSLTKDEAFHFLLTAACNNEAMRAAVNNEIVASSSPLIVTEFTAYALSRAEPESDGERVLQASFLAFQQCLRGMCDASSLLPSGITDPYAPLRSALQGYPERFLCTVCSALAAFVCWRFPPRRSSLPRALEWKWWVSCDDEERHFSLLRLLGSLRYIIQHLPSPLQCGCRPEGEAEPESACEPCLLQKHFSQWCVTLDGEVHSTGNLTYAALVVPEVITQLLIALSSHCGSGNAADGEAAVPGCIGRESLSQVQWLCAAAISALGQVWRQHAIATIPPQPDTLAGVMNLLLDLLRSGGLSHPDEVAMDLLEWVLQGWQHTVEAMLVEGKRSIRNSLLALVEVMRRGVYEATGAHEVGAWRRVAQQLLAFHKRVPLQLPPEGGGQAEGGETPPQSLVQALTDVWLLALERSDDGAQRAAGWESCFAGLSDVLHAALQASASEHEKSAASTMNPSSGWWRRGQERHAAAVATGAAAKAPLEEVREERRLERVYHVLYSHLMVVAAPCRSAVRLLRFISTSRPTEEVVQSFTLWWLCDGKSTEDGEVLSQLRLNALLTAFVGHCGDRSPLMRLLEELSPASPTRQYLTTLLSDVLPSLRSEFQTYVALFMKFTEFTLSDLLRLCKSTLGGGGGGSGSNHTSPPPSQSPTSPPSHSVLTSPTRLSQGAAGAAAAMQPDLEGEAEDQKSFAFFLLSLYQRLAPPLYTSSIFASCITLVMTTLRAKTEVLMASRQGEGVGEGVSSATPESLINTSPPPPTHHLFLSYDEVALLLELVRGILGLRAESFTLWNTRISLEILYFTVQLCSDDSHPASPPLLMITNGPTAAGAPAAISPSAPAGAGSSNSSGDAAARLTSELPPLLLLIVQRMGSKSASLSYREYHPLAQCLHTFCEFFPPLFSALWDTHRALPTRAPRPLLQLSDAITTFFSDGILPTLMPKRNEDTNPTTATASSKGGAAAAAAAHVDPTTASTAAKLDFTSPLFAVPLCFYSLVVARTVVGLSGDPGLRLRLAEQLLHRLGQLPSLFDLPPLLLKHLCQLCAASEVTTMLSRVQTKHAALSGSSVVSLIASDSKKVAHRRADCTKLLALYVLSADARNIHSRAIAELLSTRLQEYSAIRTLKVICNRDGRAIQAGPEASLWKLLSNTTEAFKQEITLLSLVWPVSMLLFRCLVLRLEDRLSCFWHFVLPELLHVLRLPCGPGIGSAEVQRAVCLLKWEALRTVDLILTVVPSHFAVFRWIFLMEPQRQFSGEEVPKTSCGLLRFPSSTAVTTTEAPEGTGAAGDGDEEGEADAQRRQVCERQAAVQRSSSARCPCFSVAPSERHLFLSWEGIQYATRVLVQHHSSHPANRTAETDGGGLVLPFPRLSDIEEARHSVLRDFPRQV